MYGEGYKGTQAFRRNVERTGKLERYTHASKASRVVDYSQLLYQDFVNYDNCYFIADRRPWRLIIGNRDQNISDSESPGFRTLRTVWNSN
jgi:hypothetical protein